MAQFTNTHSQSQWRCSTRLAPHGRVAAVPLARQTVCKGRSLILLYYTTSIVERISKRVLCCLTAHTGEHIFHVVSKGLECRCWHISPSHEVAVFFGLQEDAAPSHTTVFYILCAIFSVYTIRGIYNLCGGGILGIQKSPIQICFICVTAIHQC
jgi:hypothetical protein